MDNPILTIIIIIWLMVITAFLVYVAVTDRNAIGQTGPTGPIGPTGGVTGATGGTALTSIFNNGLNAVNTGCTTCNGGNGGINTSLINNVGSINIGAINGVHVALGNPCQFYSLNADISNYQTIPGLNTPTIVRWAFTSAINTNYISYATNGMFTLTPGRYQLTTSIVYPAINRLGSTNVGGTYKYMAIMLNDINFNNVVSDNLLIDRSQAIPLGANNITMLSLNTTFDVTALRNRLSVLMWHDSSSALEIGTTTFNNMMSTFRLTKIQ